MGRSIIQLSLDKKILFDRIKKTPGTMTSVLGSNIYYIDAVKDLET
jgi:hypothetical protein